MRGPLYQARMEDLEARDLVVVACPCGQGAKFRPFELLTAKIRRPIDMSDRVLDLRFRMRCRKCGSRGGAGIRVGRWRD